MRARTPSLEAPYVWIDPFEEQAKRFDRPQTEASVSALETAPAVLKPDVTTEAGAAAVLGAESTAPTSLVPEDLRDRPAPKRARPPRKGSKAAVAAAEAAAEAEVTTAPMPLSPDVIADPDAALPQSDTPEPDIEVVPVPAKKTRSRKKKTDEVVAEAAAEPVADIAAEPAVAEVAPEPAPEPVKELEPVVAEVDPHEIGAPPEKPKRGWWRK